MGIASTIGGRPVPGVYACAPSACRNYLQHPLVEQRRLTYIRTKAEIGTDLYRMQEGLQRHVVQPTVERKWRTLDVYRLYVQEGGGG